MADPFVGEIRIFPLDFAPDGWARCDGQLLPVAQSTALFTLLGTTYGGDGVDTFALPDLRGRVPMQAGQGPGLSARSLGATGGSDTVTLLASDLPAHSHALRASSENADVMIPGPTRSLARSSGGFAYRSSLTQPLVSMVPEALDEAGGGQAHGNLMPYVTVGFCIALQGVFPTHT